MSDSQRKNPIITNAICKSSTIKFWKRKAAKRVRAEENRALALIDINDPETPIIEDTVALTDPWDHPGDGKSYVDLESLPVPAYKILGK